MCLSLCEDVECSKVLVIAVSFFLCLGTNASKRRNGRMVGTYVCGVIESEVSVKSADRLQLLLCKVELSNVQVLLQTLLVVALGDDSNSSLGAPSQEDLSRGLVVLLSESSDGGVLEEDRGVLGLLPVELNEGLWAEGRVCGNGNTLGLSQLDESGLDEVWVVLDLESGWADLGVSEEIQNEGALEVGDTNGLGQLLLNEGLHGGPGLLDGGVAELNAGLLIVGPSGRVSDGGVDVLQGNWEVHNEEIEVLQAPVCELLAGNGLNLVTIVEGVPELADDEEVLTLHQAILDSAGNALTSFFLVAVICKSPD